MNAVTIFQGTPADIEAMIDAAVMRALAVNAQGERMTMAEVAKHFRISQRTLARHPGRYPARGADGRWLRSEVLRWDLDRRAPPAPRKIT